jgi:hypothetical protein
MQSVNEEVLRKRPGPWSGLFFCSTKTTNSPLTPRDLPKPLFRRAKLFHLAVRKIKPEIDKLERN